MISELYELASAVATRIDAGHEGPPVPIVSLGLGSREIDAPAEDLERLASLAGRHPLVLVDTVDRMGRWADLRPGPTTVAHDPASGIPPEVMALATGAVVVVADALDRRRWPARLRRDLAALCDKAALVAVATRRSRLLAGRRWQPYLRGRLAPGDPHTLVVGGTLARRPAGPPASLLAVVTCFNEADIIEATIHHLIDQGAVVHVIDNWSYDGSWELLTQLARTESKIVLERWPESGPLPTFELRRLLERIEEVAADATCDWVLHNDADELRETPWPGVTVAEALAAVDAAGYSAVDFSLLDFRPTQDGFARGVDPRTFFRSCELANQQGYTHQVRAWRQQAGQRTLLAPSAGHEPLFEGRRVFPLNFITRHYSFRSPAHAVTKLQRDRLPRLSLEETKIGWHAHLREFDLDSPFLWSPDELLTYDDDFVGDHLLALLARVGTPTPP
ncbi:MAG: glycosyltransferase family 2 protein [Acidimicrobiales bacterium]